MRKLLTIILLFISAQAFPQLTPVGPVATPTMTWYRDAGGRTWVNKGAALGWFQITDTLEVKRMIAAAGFGSGTVTSITPGIGFVSHTPITVSGTLVVDTAHIRGGLAKTSDLANYVTLGTAQNITAVKTFTTGLVTGANSTSTVGTNANIVGQNWGIPASGNAIFGYLGFTSDGPTVPTGYSSMYFMGGTKGQIGIGYGISGSWANDGRLHIAGGAYGGSPWPWIISSRDLDSIRTVDTAFISANYLNKITGGTVGEANRLIQLTIPGTSITASSGNANINLPDSGYAYKLGRLKGLKVYNLGLSGRRMQMVSINDSSVYNKRYSLIPYYKPGDYLMIEALVNDALSDSTIFTPTIWRVQCDSAVALGLVRGFPSNHIILSNMAYFNQPTAITYPHNEYRHDVYSAQMQAEATARGTLFYDDYYGFKALYLADTTLLYTDVLHPTPKGHSVIASRFNTWLTGISTVAFTPAKLKITGSEEVYGDINADQNINISNDLRIWGRIFSTGSRGVIVGDGLSPTVPNNIGGLIQPQFTSSTSTGTAALAVNASTTVNNGSAALLINDTVWGLSTSVSTTARPFVLRNVSTDWLKINTSGVITTGNWGATPITHAFGGTDNTSYTNGQILIGNSTGNGLTKATITGDATSGLVVTNGAGSIALSIDNTKYIPNSTSLQTPYNFNISGTGTAATLIGGVVKTGTGSFGGSRSLGAAGIFTPTIGNSLTTGIAGLQAIVNDGTNNRRITLVANNTDAVAGISVDFSSGGAIPIVIGENNVEFMRWGSNGNVGIGTTSPNAKLEILSTTEQLRLTYDATHFASFTVASNGTLTMSPNTIFQGSVTANSAVTVGSSGSFTTMNPSTSLYIPSTLTATSQTSAQFQFAGSSTNFLRSAFYGNFSTSLTTGANYSGSIFANAPITTFTSGTHNWLANVVVRPIGTVTNLGATVTNTTSLLIEGAGSGGTNNYSLAVASGNSFFGGTVNLSTLSLAGTSGTANQITGVNAAGTALEWKTILGSAGTGQTVTHGAGTITLSNDTATLATHTYTGRYAGINTSPTFVTPSFSTTAKNVVTQDYLPISTPSLLSITTGVNAKTVAATTLYTVPAGKTAVITGAEVIPTAATAATNGGAADFYTVIAQDIFPTTAMTTLTTTGKVYTFAGGGMAVTAAASSTIKYNQSVGATGTTLTYTIILRGYLF